MTAGKGTRRARLISFSGMDGAGKSTQITRLRAYLEGAGVRVELLTFWDDVARLKSIRERSSHTLFGGDKGVGTPEAPINRRDKNVKSRLMTGVRLFLYFVDAVSLRSVVKKAACCDVDIVILDRYAYDEFANLDLRYGLNRLYVRLVMTLIPRPDISYVLDADPVVARARKPEYPLDFLHECRASYLALSDLVGGMTVVPAMSLDEVQQYIRKAAQEILRATPMA